MADEPPNSMNLDLNLGPVDHPSQWGQPGSMNLNNWLDGPLREAFGQRTRTRQRWLSIWRPGSVPIESTDIALELFSDNGTETGEGSVAAEEIPTMEPKSCDNFNGVLEDEAVKKKDDVEKGNNSEGNFFDCNICLDLASDPVVTCCGHLFCWPCLYRWLNVHSFAKECPICKGEVNRKSLTPIYGRGNKTRELKEDSSLKIPHRPIARRVESCRGNRFNLSRDLNHLVNPQPHTPDSTRELPAERSNTFLDQILSPRAMRREHFHPPTPGQSRNMSVSEQIERNRLMISSILSQRSSRAAAVSNLTSEFSSTERLVDSFFRPQSEETRQEHQSGVDDRDSVSSIAAIIQSQSLTLDTNTTVEIDSTSSSSSRRRREPSRTSEVDSGDSLHRRRRQC